MVAMILERNLDIPADYKLPFDHVKRKIFSDKINYLTVDDYIATEVVKRYLSEHGELLLQSQAILHGLFESKPLREFLTNYGHLIHYESLWETQLLTIMPWLTFPKHYTCEHFFSRPKVWRDVFQTASELGRYPYRNFLNDGMKTILSHYSDRGAMRMLDYEKYQDFIVDSLVSINGVGADLWIDNIKSVKFESYGKLSTYHDRINTYYRAGGTKFKGNPTDLQDVISYLDFSWNEIDIGTFPSLAYDLPDVDDRLVKLLKSNGNNIKLFHVTGRPSPVSLEQLYITNYDALASYFTYNGTVPMAILEQKIADLDIDTLPDDFPWTSTLVYRWIHKSHQQLDFRKRCYQAMAKFHSFTLLLLEQINDFSSNTRLILLQVTSKLCVDGASSDISYVSLMRLISSLSAPFTTKYIAKYAPDALHFIGNQFVAVREMLINGSAEPDNVPVQYLNMYIIMETIWKKGYAKFRYFAKPSQLGINAPKTITFDQILPNTSQIYTIVVDWNHPGYIADIDPNQIDLIHFLISDWVKH